MKPADALNMVEAMLSAGVPVEQALAATRAAVAASTKPVMSGAERTRRWRDRQTVRDICDESDVTDVTSVTNVTDIAASPRAETEPTTNLETSYQKAPLKGGQKGKVSDADLAVGAEAVAAIAALKAIPDHAYTAHQSVLAALSEAGFTVTKEVPVAAEDGGGRLDVVAHKDGGRVAIEIDAKSMREKSLRKLRAQPCFRIACLRRPVDRGESLPDIHAVVGIDTKRGQAWARGSRLPENWQPNEGEREFSRRLGMTETQIDRTALRFRNYWISQPGQKGVKLNWTATWQNWCSSEAEKLGCSPRADVPVAIYGFYAMRGSPQWEAWEIHTRQTKGRSPPCDARGGWHFPAEWPPPATTASA